MTNTIMTLGELRNAWKSMDRPNIRRGLRGSRSDAGAEVLGIPVSMITLRDVVRLKSIPDEALVTEHGDTIKVRWKGGRAGLDLRHMTDVPSLGIHRVEPRNKGAEVANVRAELGEVAAEYFADNFEAFTKPRATPSEVFAEQWPEIQSVELVA